MRAAGRWLASGKLASAASAKVALAYCRALRARLFFAFSSPIGNAAAGPQPLGPDMRAFVTDSGFDPMYGPVILKIEAPRFAPDVRKPARNE